MDLCFAIVNSVVSIAFTSIKVIRCYFILDSCNAQVHFMYCFYFFWVVIYTLVLTTHMVYVRKASHALTENCSVIIA